MLYLKSLIRVSACAVHLAPMQYELYMSVLTPLSFYGEYKRTHSLQNYQSNSVFRLSCQFDSALLFGNKTRKRFKDTLSNESPGTCLIIPRVCHCFLISFKTAFIVHVVMRNFLA